MINQKNKFNNKIENTQNLKSFTKNLYQVPSNFYFIELHIHTSKLKINQISV